MADKREEKKKKKERTPGTFAQMKQVYQMTKKSDPNIGWILSLSALGTPVSYTHLTLPTTPYV